MADDAEFPQPRFEPLEPAPRDRLILIFLLGPLLWLVALLLVAAVLERTTAIEIGLIVTVATFLVSLVVLTLLRIARGREERRFAARG
jgi:hypothetical protein